MLLQCFFSIIFRMYNFRRQLFCFPDIVSFLNDDARAVALHYIRGKWGLISPTILSSSLFTPVRYDYPPLSFCVL